MRPLEAIRYGNDGNLLIYAEMLLDMGDADFELEPLVDFAVFEFAQLGVFAIELCVELLKRRLRVRLLAR
jgi:hypothetical protein